MRLRRQTWYLSDWVNGISQTLSLRRRNSVVLPCASSANCSKHLSVLSPLQLLFTHRPNSSNIHPWKHYHHTRRPAIVVSTSNCYVGLLETSASRNSRQIWCKKVSFTNTQVPARSPCIMTRFHNAR